MIFFITVIYNVFLLVGTAWLVGWQGWSGWWFALTVLLIGDSTNKLCK